MASLSGRSATDADLARSIRAYDENRRLVSDLYDLRASQPWRVPASEAYLVLRAGMLLPVEEHTRLVAEYLEAVLEAPRRERDDARIVLRGVFCEQPPLGLIRTLERAGCYVVDDDFLLVSRWLGPFVGLDEHGGDPIAALARAYLAYEGESASRFVADGAVKGKALIDSVGRTRAEGVIFASPSFCDPALLDRPMLQAALAEKGISFTSFKYSENTGQMQPIREQAGTFADTIKLWGGTTG
jgi:benzoyl-CoA reductase subunit C